MLRDWTVTGHNQTDINPEMNRQTTFSENSELSRKTLKFSPIVTIRELFA